MYPDDETRMRHMRDAARDAVTFTAERNRSDLDSDRMLMLAVTRCIEIIGEAASQVTPEGRERYPQIPWRQAIDMRNRIIHAYFNVNLDVVWTTVRWDLPALIDVLESVLPPEEPSHS